jgi:hypothetical protein
MRRPLARVQVASRTLDSVGYDGATGVLEVMCTDGSLYRYTHVPEEVHLQLMHAPSKGDYWRRHIHGVYPYERVATALPADL